VETPCGHCYPPEQPNDCQLERNVRVWYSSFMDQSIHEIVREQISAKETSR
jgi:hypothetical protein